MYVLNVTDADIFIKLDRDLFIIEILMCNFSYGEVLAQIVCFIYIFITCKFN